LRIALISYEGPPDNPHGGIATYVGQAAMMLAQRGHDVELFVGSHLASDSRCADGVVTHRIRAATHDQFAECIVPTFLVHHAQKPFDVIEAPEFQAEYRHLIRRVPEVPLVVKLHTPTFMIRRLMTEGWRYDQPSWRRRLWQLQNQLELGLDTAPLDDPERKEISRAAAVAAPCEAIRTLIVREWQVNTERIRVVPYPFQPDHGLIHVSPGAEAPVIAFLGRVEVRKGVVDLADAFSLIHGQVPRAELWFIGADGEAADGTESMAKYLTARVPQAAQSMRFFGRVDRSHLPELLKQAAVVALPSLWENFPLACLESMSAARPTVVTAGTGMEEMADDGRAAVVVPPRDPKHLAWEITRLLEDPARRDALGDSARRRVLDAYSWEAIGPVQEGHYQQAIVEHRQMGSSL
jgi:glycosyltransferase involved in cell wall biosynthesis